mmetsp:Transcript_3405/g.15503  ORF Transcript_3405/g.15503 Transcript_3405/m.15503 type:complete len:216 (-) Transcript_3405:313-960(-)
MRVYFESLAGGRNPLMHSVSSNLNAHVGWCTVGANLCTGPVGTRCIVSLSPSLFCIECSKACSLSSLSTKSVSLRSIVARCTSPLRTFSSNLPSYTGSTCQSFPPFDNAPGPHLHRFDGGSSASADASIISARALATSGMYLLRTFFLAFRSFAACARTILPLSWVAQPRMARSTASAISVLSSPMYSLEVPLNGILVLTMETKMPILSLFLSIL